MFSFELTKARRLVVLCITHMGIVLTSCFPITIKFLGPKSSESASSPLADQLYIHGTE